MNPKSTHCRITLLLLLIVTALSVAACSPGDNSAPTIQSLPTQVATSAPPTVLIPTTLPTSSTAATVSSSTPLLAGDPVRGKQSFPTLPCASCHDVSKPWPGGDICPNLGNIATEAARIVKSPDYHGKATDAAGYIRESIMNPNAYIVPGSQYRTPLGESVMPKNFGQTLQPAQIDDLVAYLMTLK